jgi:RecA-family ATPase
MEISESLYSFASITQWIDHEPPRRRDLLHNLLPLGRTGFIVGARAIGKSQFVLQLAVSIATATPLCGHWPVAESGGVLALFGEDDDAELRRRLWHIQRTLTPEFESGRFVDRLRRNLHVASVAGTDTQLSMQWGSGVRWTDYLQKLIATAQSIDDLKLIIVDPVNRFRGEKENGNQAMARFLEALEYIVDETGASVLAVHLSKGGARLSSLLAEEVRWQMNLSAMNQTQAKRLAISPEQCGHYLHVSIPKNSYAPPAADCWLQRDHGGLLRIVHCDND